MHTFYLEEITSGVSFLYRLKLENLTYTISDLIPSKNLKSFCKLEYMPKTNKTEYFLYIPKRVLNDDDTEISIETVMYKNKKVKELKIVSRWYVDALIPMSDYNLNAIKKVVSEEKFYSLLLAIEINT